MSTLSLLAFSSLVILRLELLSVLATIVEFGPLLRDRTVLFVTDSLSLVTIMLNGRVPHGKNAAYALQTLLEAAAEWRITVRLKWKRRNSCPWTKAADTLSHADYHGLPLNLMPGLSFSKLQFPDPISSAISRASSDKPEDFACLRDLVKAHWARQNWNRSFLLHL